MVLMASKMGAVALVVCLAQFQHFIEKLAGIWQAAVLVMSGLDFVYYVTGWL